MISKSTPLAIVDIETTGANPATSRIIEVGIIRIEDGREVARYETLINPGMALHNAITALTGITGDMLDPAPTFDEVALDIAEMLSGAVFIAHNVRFDYTFLKSEFRRLELPFQERYLCSAKLSRALYPRHTRHNLDSIISRFGITCKRRHRAFDDALAVWDFLQLAAADRGEKELYAHMSESALARTTPPQLAKENIDTLPDGPGVYFFYGKDNKLLYVGKSVNIKSRVLSHFASDYESVRGARLCDEVARVEAQTTAGELGALLLESHLIKSELPVYNQASRHRKALLVLRQSQTKEGYQTVTLEQASKLSPHEHDTILGIVRSTTQAKSVLTNLAKEHNLCHTLLGLERGIPCFSHQLEICRGACAGKESAKSYNRRFKIAFENRKVRTWPFHGPIAIEEKDSHSSGELFIVDSWCLIAAYRYTKDGYEDLFLKNLDFDYDVYKILAKHILRPKNRNALREISPIDLDRMLRDSEHTIT